MGSRDEKKPQAGKLEDADKKVKRVYLCPGESSIIAYYNIRDEEGKLIPETNGRGDKKYSGKNPVYKMDIIKFELASAKIEITDTFKSMCQYTLLAEDDHYFDKLKVLEQMRNDPSNMVMDLEMYDKWRNPEAANAIIENRQLKKDNEEKDSIISKIMKENEEYKAKLARINK